MNLDSAALLELIHKRRGQLLKDHRELCMSMGARSLLDSIKLKMEFLDTVEELFCDPGSMVVTAATDQQGEPMKKTLETYLRENVARNVIDFQLRASLAGDGRVVFYIHPSGVDGETTDFEVAGNQLAHNRDIVHPAVGEEKT